MSKYTANAITRDQAYKAFKVILAAAVFWGILIAMGWAAETLPSPVETSQSTVSADNTPQSTSVTQASSAQPVLTQDFLMDTSPLSKPALRETESLAEAAAEVVAVDGNGRNCSTSGNGSAGSQDCITRDPSGSFTESTSNWENFGDETKEQTVARHYNSNGDSAGEDTLRIKTNYRTDYNGNKHKEREFYDIVNQPPQGLIARDLIVKEFDSKGQVKKITWAHYIEIGTRKAGLEHHAVLYYENGKLTSGFANKYKNGKVVDTLLNYDPSKNPNLRMEKTGVMKWATWIDGLTQPAVSIAHN